MLALSGDVTRCFRLHAIKPSCKVFFLKQKQKTLVKETHSSSLVNETLWK